MDKDFFCRMEKLLERELTHHEKERLTRIQNILGIRDNDELWSIVAAMEYQRAYYDELPQKIREASAEAVKQISSVSNQGIVETKNRLAEKEAEHAKDLTVQAHRNTLVLWETVAVMVLLVYGGLMQWAGYCMGTGKIGQLPDLLRMPVGLPVAALSFGAFSVMGWQSADDASRGNRRWIKRFMLAIAFFVPALTVFILTVY